MIAVMHPGAESRIVEAFGKDGLGRLVAAFFRRVPGDPVLGPMYRASVAQTGETMAAAEGRLRDFLLYRMGIDDGYVRERGHPRLRARHMKFAIDAPAAARWVELMEASMVEINIGGPAAADLRSFFADTAAWMVNRGQEDESGA